MVSCCSLTRLHAAPPGDGSIRTNIGKAVFCLRQSNVTKQSVPENGFTATHLDPDATMAHSVVCMYYFEALNDHESNTEVQPKG